MIEVGNRCFLRLENVTLDDKGKTEGTEFEEQLPERPTTNSNKVQDAIIASYDGDSTITLGEGTVLKNFGGMSAVRVTNATVIMEAGSSIIDDLEFDRGGGFGAVWIQSGRAEMEDGSSINNVYGRAIYVEEEGSASINGTISEIKYNNKLKEGKATVEGHNGFAGYAVYIETNSDAVIGETGLITDMTHGHVQDVLIFVRGGKFSIESGAQISNIDFCILEMDGGENVIINGEISDCHAGGNVLIRMRQNSGARSPLTISENAVIKNCSSEDVGLIYIQNYRSINFDGEISENEAQQILYMGSSVNGVQTYCTIGEHAKIINNTVAENVIYVNNGGIATMNGGEISGNSNTAIYVKGKNDRQKASFTMNGGRIINNSGYGVVYETSGNSQSTVILNGGEISGNNAGDAQIQFILTNGKAEDLYEYFKIAPRVLQGITSLDIKNSTEEDTLTLDADYDTIAFGKAYPQARQSLVSGVIAGERSGWTEAMGYALWFTPSAESLHFTITKPVNAGDTGLYMAYVPLDASGTQVEGSLSSPIYVENEDLVDITLTGLTPDQPYAWMLFNSDNYVVSPKSTTIYTGGASGANEKYTTGFPGDEFTGIPDGAQIIAGEQTYDAPEDLFTVEYWKDGAAAANDQEEGVYEARIVRKDGGDISNGELKISQNGVEQSVDFQTGQLVVRYISDADAAIQEDAITTALFASEEAAHAAIAASGKAAAVAGDGTVFTTNGDPRRVISSAEGIALLDDAILTGDAFPDGGSRETRLQEKGARELIAAGKIRQDMADDLNYDFHYLDLVDTHNGNAWVSSSSGTTVYIPYPEGTGSSTEFYVLHYKDLHREYGINGQDAIDEAINSCEVELIDEQDSYEKMINGLKFHIPASGFSPFVLVWTEEEPVDIPEEPGTDTPDDTPETNQPDRTYSGSDSDGSSYNDTSSSYTVGISGNWVHVDPQDPNIPIRVDVPEYATPVTNPEYHMWKFVLTDGTILRNQWAFIRNPYAVGQQPTEGWFRFDTDGIMEYGWYLDTNTNKWYYLHRQSDGMLGTMLTGWHYDEQDGKWYYLNPVNGEMLLGWQYIDGSWYFFNPAAAEVTWNYEEESGGWRYNGSAARPYGSMYENETTPDGYAVGEDGAWIQ